jgi:hypothetical protein
MTPTDASNARRGIIITVRADPFKRALIDWIIRIWIDCSRRECRGTMMIGVPEAGKILSGR